MDKMGEVLASRDESEVVLKAFQADDHMEFIAEIARQLGLTGLDPNATWELFPQKRAISYIIRYKNYQLIFDAGNPQKRTDAWSRIVHWVNSTAVTDRHAILNELASSVGGGAVKKIEGPAPSQRNKCEGLYYNSVRQIYDQEEGRRGRRPTLDRLY
jgi:hypothetical protein